MTAKRDRISEFLFTWREEHPGEPFLPELERVSASFAVELRSESLGEIRSLLAECESKKRALEKEFPHLKRIYSPSSDNHEEWEYYLCEELIPHFRLEIKRRGRRSNESETAVTPKTTSNSDTLVQSEFKYSPDYRSVTLQGAQYALTSRQAQFIQILHEAHTNGTPGVSISHILEQLGTRNSRWQDTFKGNPSARKALITSGRSKGTLRLNL